MINYWISHQDKFIEALLQHLQIVLITLFISLLLSFVLSLLIKRSRKLSNIVISLFGGIYSIPSLALFALLIPITGLGNTTAIIVLVVYNQFLLLRNIIQGFDSIDKSIIEAAKGMGMNNWQIYYKIELPLALPLILSAIRLCIISTIAIATIASSVGGGGLGTILFQGLRQSNEAKLIGGTLLCVLLTLIFNGFIKIIETRLKSKYHL